MINSSFIKKISPGRRALYIRDLLRELVVRDIKLKYKRSILGMGWSLLNPIAELTVYAIVFGNLLPVPIDSFLVFLFIGILVWNWFQTSVLSATRAIVGNRDLIKRPGFPSPVLPLISVTSNLIHFLIALPILIIVLIYEQTPVTAALAALPLLLILQFVFTMGISYFLATLHVTFRDIEYLLGILLRLMLFLSGIFYDPIPLIEKIPALNFNPMLHFVQAYRTILIDGQLPKLLPFAILSFISVALLVYGYSIFINASHKYVEEV